MMMQPTPPSNSFQWRLPLLAAALLLLASPLSAQQLRLIDQEPFDQLLLKPGPAPSVPEGQEAQPPEPEVVKLRPLEMTPRRPVVPGEPDEEVRLRHFDRPLKQYEVAWRHIQELRLFEELVLTEASGLVDRQLFDEAYEFYLFLEARDAEFPGVAAGMQRCLFLEASSRHRAGESAQALALLLEVYRRNPVYDKLAGAFGTVVDKLAAEHLAAGRYAAARLLLQGLKEKFPDQPAVAAREAELQTLAEQAVTAARAASEGGDSAAALAHVRRALAVWPEVDGAADLARELRTRHPIVEVGVTQLPSPAPSAREAARWDWAARRNRRLLHRELIELVGFSGPVGKYECPLGTCEADGATLTLRLREGLKWSNGEPVGGFDLAQSVLSRGLAGTRTGSGNLGFSVVQAVDDRIVALTLSGLHFQPLALLQLPLHPWYDGTDAAATLGPYRQKAADADAAVANDSAAAVAPLRFLAQEGYFARQAGQPQEIVERFFASSNAAAGALESGEIAIVDRVPPWEVDRLRALPGVVVESYAAPTVHVLVPNTGRPLMANAAFRRALSVGLHRQRILQALLRGGDASRGQALGAGLLVDGTAGSSAYDPGTMLALVSVALAEVGSAELAPAGTTAPAAWPRLVLAHPPTEVARRACRAIQEHWQLAGLGLVVELREEPPGAETADWDLRYVEWPLFDATVDLPALLGAHDLALASGPWLQAAARRLASAVTPDAAAAETAAILRCIEQETLVLPLWSLTEHLAYREGLSGVGSRPATLYQNVEAWRLAPEIAP